MVGFVPYDIRNKPCTAVFSELKLMDGPIILGSCGGFAKIY